MKTKTKKIKVESDLIIDAEFGTTNGGDLLKRLRDAYCILFKKPYGMRLNGFILKKHIKRLEWM